MRTLIIAILVALGSVSYGQTTNAYEISFGNAVHHEADIKATFLNLESKVLELRMSRTSPGRYALHEFAKNIYNVKATDSRGRSLSITRPSPYAWHVAGHDGTVNLRYTLFADRGDGTYAQVDETHAHLNIPATFMYAPALSQRPIEITFNLRDDLNWKVATQLKSINNNTYYAPDLHYFMDSPVEISNYQVREFTDSSNGKSYTIRFVLHHNGTEEELDTYFDKVHKIVAEEKAVYGELPDFDYGTYTFLACYMPNASGDGMEHRNSTILTSTRSLAEGGMERNIGTVSHEFFHAWNVERIRPITLEPFNYEEANMSGELWFAEGFTSYYTSLILCRAGLISETDYINGLAGSLNYVWNSPALTYFNPIEMSYQAPFVDAATSVDPVNRENTFISYYSYGSVLGLALDLSLRNLDDEYNLDNFMALVWKKFGKSEIPYTVKDIQSTLAEYAGKSFADRFFTEFIYQSKMPDYKTLLASAGVGFGQRDAIKPHIGASVQVEAAFGELTSNPHKDSPAYKAGLAKGDKIVSIEGKPLDQTTDFDQYITQFEPEQNVNVIYKRNGKKKETILQFESDPAYKTFLMESADIKITKGQKQFRSSWLGSKNTD